MAVSQLKGEQPGGGDLPPRKPTFLARYPRSLKMGGLLFVVVLIALTPALLRQLRSEGGSNHKPSARPDQGLESQAANPSPSLVKTNDVPAPAADTGPEVLNDQDNHDIKLVPAPVTGLFEDTPQGNLPQIAEDGRQPWQVYARPFNTADKRPRIAIVITDLGLSRIDTDATINRMPTNVTLAFSAESPLVGAWMTRARQAGHETLLQIPMEPFDYPRSDPGPGALLTTIPNSDNLIRLNLFLRQATGYVGITSLSGSHFTTESAKLKPVLESLRQRGLMIFDARVAPHSAIMDLARDMHVSAAAENERLDQNLSPEAIDAALLQLEQTARLTGRAVGMTSPTPLMLDRLQAWLKDLPKRGIALAPISVMVQ